MIRLIAADMDGTLLNSRKELPEELPQLLLRLKRENIRFVVASGRQYQNLLAQFPGMEGDITFLSENGSMIFEKGKPIFLEPMERPAWMGLVSALRQIPGACPILCGAKTAYYESTEPEFLENARIYYAKLAFVPDLLAVKDPEICKVAVYDLLGAETNSFPIMKSQTANQFQTALSGEKWIDIMGQSTKGAGLTVLQKLYGVSPEETMAFGDYLNDLEMMDACFYSCAMANAHPELKRQARFVVPSNEENGVIRAIVRSLGLDGTAFREIPFGGPEYRESLLQRNEILRKPLGLDLFSEDLSQEAEYRHLAALKNGTVVGTMVMTPDRDRSDASLIRQVTVAESCRKQGVGRQLADLAAGLAEHQGYSLLTVHARKTAKGFYEKCGFTVTGPEFLQMGLPHLPMARKLP